MKGWTVIWQFRRTLKYDTSAFHLPRKYLPVYYLSLINISEVAKQAGIEGADRYVDASSLKRPEQMKEAVLSLSLIHIYCLLP